MTLMLGNRYFLDRDYERAVPLLEAAVDDDPECLSARKKLVIAHVQMGNVDTALVHFEFVLRRAPRLIIDTNAEVEDCPCPSLCAVMESRLADAQDPFPVLVSLGVLETYCDLVKARQRLDRARSLRPRDERLGRLLAVLEKEEPACRTR